MDGKQEINLEWPQCKHRSLSPKVCVLVPHIYMAAFMPRRWHVDDYALLSVQENTEGDDRQSACIDF